MSLDGKKLRRSHDRPHGHDGLWLVSAWVSDKRMVLGQHKVDETSNEITAIPELLALLDLTGCVVTVDAIDSQTDLAQQIVSAKAAYILPVKANQGTLYAQIQLLFAGLEHDNYRDVSYDTDKQITEGHDRREFRQCWVVSDAPARAYLRRGAGWAKLTA